MLSCVKGFFHFIDFSGFSMSFQMNNHKNYKTLFGGLISFIICVLTIAGVAYFGKEMFDKSNPTITVSVTDYTDVGPFDFSIDNFYSFFAFEVANLTLYKDPRVVDFTANKVVIVYGNEDQQEAFNYNVEIGPCNDYFKTSDFPTDVMQIIDLNYYYCISPKEQNLTIEGYWGNGKVYSNLVVSASKCVNTTENNNFCRSPDEINSIVEGGIFNVRPKNQQLQIYNLTNPIQYVYEDIYYSLSSSVSPSIFLNLKMMNFVSDTGFIFEDLLSINTYFFESGSEHVLYYGSRGNTLANITFQGKPLGQTIRRSYQKFQDILTKLGGLIKALMVVGSLMTYFVSRSVFLIDLSEKKREKAKEAKEVKYNHEPISNNYLNKEKKDFFQAKKAEFPIKNDKINKIDLKLDKSNAYLNRNIFTDDIHVNTNCSKIRDFFFVFFKCKSKLIYKKTEKINQLIDDVVSLETQTENFYFIKYMMSERKDKEKEQFHDFQRKFLDEKYN